MTDTESVGRDSNISNGGHLELRQLGKICKIHGGAVPRIEKSAPKNLYVKFGAFVQHVTIISFRALTTSFFALVISKMDDNALYHLLCDLHFGTKDVKHKLKAATSDMTTFEIPT